jgi:hypothetical protein
MQTILKVYENANVRVGKTVITRIALYSRVIGSNLNLVAADGTVSTWLLADAPAAVRDFLAHVEPTSQREIC